MKILLCENNLVGFLTAVYYAYYDHRDAEFITANSSKVTLLDSAIEISADIEFAEKVRSGLINNAGKPAYKEIIDAYLCSISDKEQVLFSYMKLLFTHGRKVREMYGNDAVMLFNEMLRKVRGETHRLSGFVRLQELDNGTFYSFFVSDHDILELLITELIPQYNAQKLILHDAGRKKLIYYDGTQCHKLLAPDGVDITLSENEVELQKLWKMYHKTVSIESRKNPRLQNHFMPKKYRFFMHEF